MTDLERLKAIENDKKHRLEQVLKKLLEQYQFRAYGVRLK